MRRYQDVRRKSPVSPSQRGLWSPRAVYHGWRRAAYSWPALCVFVVLLGLLVSPLWAAYGRFSATRTIRNEAAAKLSADEARKAELEKQIKELDTEAGKEVQIRRNYQVALPGEGVIVLVGTSSAQ